ncbi:MAG: DUF374 domain-containing protein [bacterium]|nr:DUF374 domain-containing protein [bacterium]
MKRSCRINKSVEASPVIYASLHQDMIAALMHVSSTGATLLVSNSKDGDLLESILSGEGLKFIRGSTGQSGSLAVKRLVAELRSGNSIGLAVDGPKGPHGAIQEGVIAISRLSGCPIVPLTMVYSRKINLKNWDKTAVPIPFSKTVVTAGEKINCEHESATVEVLADALLKGQL